MKTKTVEQLIQQTEIAIQQAEAEQSKLIPEILSLEGMSSRKNRHFLNNLLQEDDSYLEIGCWKGSTLVSALYKNKYKLATACDSFPDENLNLIAGNFGNPKQTFLNNVNKFVPDQVDFFDIDCFSLLEKENDYFKDKKYNIYFYDAEHTHETQYNAISYFYDIFDDNFILIVDDWNDSWVKTGTHSAILDKKFTVHKAWDIPSRWNCDEEGWWNGVYIAVLGKNN